MNNTELLAISLKEMHLPKNTESGETEPHLYERTVERVIAAYLYYGEDVEFTAKTIVEIFKHKKAKWFHIDMMNRISPKLLRYADELLEKSLKETITVQEFISHLRPVHSELDE